MTIKAKIKAAFYNKTIISFLTNFFYYSYKLKDVFGIKTKGYSQIKGLALFKILQKHKTKSVQVALLESVSLNKTNMEYHNWSLREPENHITICLSVKEKNINIVIGKVYKPNFIAHELENEIRHANNLLNGRQYLKGVENIVAYVVKSSLI